MAISVNAQNKFEVKDLDRFKLHSYITADMSAVDFQIAYLKKVNQVVTQQRIKEAFIAAMKVVYPGIAGETDLVIRK